MPFPEEPEQIEPNEFTPSGSDVSSDTTVSISWSGDRKPDVIIPAKIENVEVGREIGRGGMGVVFDGWDSVLHRRVAVKFLLGAVPAPDDPNFEQFLEGARAEAALRHPNIVAVHTAGVVANVPYMVMDFIRGPTLREMSRALGPMPPAAALLAAWEVASAVDALHERELIHRDLKPGNIIADETGRLYVTDFGLASLRRRTASVESTAGTPAYMAAEVFEGKSTPRSDVYAIGIMLFELLAGKLPFTGRGEELRRQHAESPLPVGELPPGTPHPVVEILVRATHKTEMFRYKSAGHLQRVLEDAALTEGLRRDGSVALKEIATKTMAAAGEKATLEPGRETPTSSYFQRISELAEQKRDPQGRPAQLDYIKHTEDGVTTSYDIAPDQPGWREVMLAPWVFMLRPRRAASCLIRGSRTAVCLSFAMGVMLTVVAGIGMDLWDDTYSESWERSSSKLNARGRYDHSQFVRERTVAEVWQYWHRRHGLGYPADTSLAYIITMSIGVAVIAWLNLPFAHEGGPPWESCARTLRVATAAVGFFALCELLAGALDMLANDYSVGSYSLVGTMVPFNTVVSRVCLTLVWVGVAVRGTRRAAPPIELPPRCEECGYDLRHQPDDGRCPECGLAVAESLTPNLRRTGCAWENRRNPIAWLASSWEALIRPRRFHGALKLHPSDATMRGFAAWNYVAVAITAVACILVWITMAPAPRRPTLAEAVQIACVLPLFFGLLAWAIHRTVAAVAATGWLIDNLLPEFRWSRRVVTYEAVFLWVVLLYNFVIGSAIGVDLFKDWTIFYLNSTMYDLFIYAAMIFGNTALALLWLRRFRVAVRAVRWSNF